MQEIRILTNKLYIKNRNGEYDEISFPVLKIIIEENDYNILNANLNSYFSIKLHGYDIEKYSQECPDTLYCDKPLYVSEGYSIWNHHKNCEYVLQILAKTK